MIIRKEEICDFKKIYSLVKIAFESAEHSDGNEHELVNKLRKGKSFIPELSLVCEIDGKIVGHIMFTKAEINGNTVLVLAPLSVLPENQNLPASKFGIKASFDVPDENFMAYKINKNIKDNVCGTIKYAKEFGID